MATVTGITQSGITYVPFEIYTGDTLENSAINWETNNNAAKKTVYLEGYSGTTSYTDIQQLLIWTNGVKGTTGYTVSTTETTIPVLFYSLNNLNQIVTYSDWPNFSGFTGTTFFSVSAPFCIWMTWSGWSHQVVRTDATTTSNPRLLQTPAPFVYQPARQIIRVYSGSTTSVCLSTSKIYLFLQKPTGGITTDGKEENLYDLVVPGLDISQNLIRPSNVSYRTTQNATQPFTTMVDNYFKIIGGYVWNDNGTLVVDGTNDYGVGVGSVLYANDLSEPNPSRLTLSDVCSTPLKTDIIGSVIVDFNLNDEFTGSYPYYKIVVDGVTQYSHTKDASFLYSSLIGIGKTVTFEIYNFSGKTNQFTLKRIDYTTKDTDDDVGIKETIFTQENLTSNYSISFLTGAFINSYNFEYRLINNFV